MGRGRRRRARRWWWRCGLRAGAARRLGQSSQMLRASRERFRRLGAQFAAVFGGEERGEEGVYIGEVAWARG
jgi:hypothetical protein